MTFSNISSISIKKGIDQYIYAIEKLNNKNTQFDIVGKAAQVEKDFENDMRKYVLGNKIENITFKGFITNINDYLKEVDVVVLTSNVPDSLPTVLLEGLAKGKVLIGTDVGGVSEIIDTSYGNMIVPINDIEALTNAFEKVINYTQEQMFEIKQKNIKLAKEKFSLSTQIKKIENIYEEVYSS
jgi:glycosyltransferase involved in cell wall biosynthesis